ncbi:MAG: TonB-dependent receptor [Proteobacteria bacterium]|nr:TonB-dependent receptor [Pseudomonadota bacterium]
MSFGVRTRLTVIELLIGAGLVLANLPAFATETHRFDVPDQEAPSAIRVFATQARVQILVAGENVKNKHLHAVSGEFSTEQGLRLLLADSGLTPQFVGNRSIALVSTSAPPPQVVSDKAPDSAPEPRVEKSDELAEVVVTALKRNTRIQDTPIAISAVTGDSLQKAGNTDFTQLTRSAPSLRIVDSGPGQRRVLIRGIQASGEPTVGVYYDESPVAGSVGTTSDAASSTPDFRLFDVERAEVLRGPQGTLFGAGSMGGTIRVIFQKPKMNRFEAAASADGQVVQHGKGGGSLDAMVNLPVIDDKVAVRLVGFYQQYAGYVDNNRLGLTNINDGHSTGGRALIRLTPIDRLTVDLAAYYQDVATGSPRWVLETGQPWVTNARAESGNFDTDRIFSATAHYDLDFATITGVSSYFDRNKITDGDVSNTFLGRDTPAGCQKYLTKTRACTSGELSSYLVNTRELFSSSLYQPQYVHDFTNELRMSSAGADRFNWTVGVYTENRISSVRSTLLLANPDTGTLLPFVAENIEYDRTIDDHLSQVAGFLELSYKILPSLTFTTGARYYKYDKSVGGRVDVGQINYASVVTPETVAESSQHGVIGKFNLSWQAQEGLLVYAQAAQGFRPGGVNQVIGLPAALAAYSSDSLWDYELGIKSTIARGIYLNLTGYRIDWENIQVSGRTAGTGSVFGLISNAGAARIWGSEAELTANLTKGLTLSANVGYTDARLSADQTSTVVVAAGKKDDRLAYVPQYTLGASLEYLHPLAGPVDAFFHADTSFVGGSYSSISPTDIYRRYLPAYQVGNVRFGAQKNDETWGAYLYVNNIADSVAIVSASTSSNTLGQTLVYSLPPRTFGLNLTYKF